MRQLLQNHIKWAFHSIAIETKNIQTYRLSVNTWSNCFLMATVGSHFCTLGTHTNLGMGNDMMYFPSPSSRILLFPGTFDYPPIRGWGCDGERGIWLARCGCRRRWFLVVDVLWYGCDGDILGFPGTCLLPTLSSCCPGTSHWGGVCVQLRAAEAFFWHERDERLYLPAMSGHLIYHRRISQVPRQQKISLYEFPLRVVLVFWRMGCLVLRAPVSHLLHQMIPQCRQYIFDEWPHWPYGLYVWVFALGQPWVDDYNLH